MAEEKEKRLDELEEYTDALLKTKLPITIIPVCGKNEKLYQKYTKLKEKLPQTDLILFGQTAIDGETGQTGVSTATRLGLTAISNVVEIVEISENSITINTETEKEKITLKTKLPCSLCVNNYVFKPRVPRINGYMRAQDYNYKLYDINDLSLDANETGIKGSPTYVSKVFKNQEGRDCKIINFEEDGSLQSIMKEILEQ